MNTPKIVNTEWTDKDTDVVVRYELDKKLGIERRD